MPYTIDDEKISQSPEFALGRVEDKEDLLRIGFHPEHILDGQIIETAISSQDLRERGFSVDRRSYVERSIVEERANRQMSNKPEGREEFFVSMFRCKAVRSLNDDDGERAFIVIDTALVDNPAHASIYSAKQRGRGAIKKLKTLLLPLLQNRSSVDEVFSPSTAI